MMLTFFVHSTVIGVDDKGDEIQCVLYPLSVLLNLFWVMDHSGWQLQVRVKFLLYNLHTVMEFVVGFL